MQSAGAVLFDAGGAGYVPPPVEEFTPPPLLGPDGTALAPDPMEAAIAMEKMFTLSGERMFPDAAANVKMADGAAPAWAAMAPGPELAYELTRQPLTRLGADGVVEVIAAHARLVAHHQALMAEAIAELAPRPEYQHCTNPAGGHDAALPAATEISLAMTWTPGYADDRMRVSVRLVEELPATLQALRSGRIDEYKAQVISDVLAALDESPELRAEAERQALRVAADKTGPALRAYLKRVVDRLAPDVADKRRAEARKTRRVSKPFVEGDGMASLEVFGPVEDLAALFTAVDAAACSRRDAANRAGEGHPDYGASLAALRFDVLTDLGWSGLNAGHLGCCAAGCDGAAQPTGKRHGRAATVNVTMALSTLLGADDEPAELEGYGPVSARVARAIAADASLRRLLTDPVSGVLLDYGTTRYVPPQHLADHVIARDRTCRFPTCSRPASSCDLDHTVPHRGDGSGGATADHNLGPFDRRHHNDKTHHRFTVDQPEPGRFVITTPAGRVYHVEPEVLGPGHDPPATPPSNDQSATKDHPTADPPPW
jgi:hypothetical protein